MSAEQPREGEPLQISASRLLKAYEAGDDFARRRRLGRSPASQPLSIDLCSIRVKNETGSDLSAGDAVELGDKLLTTLDRRHLWLSAALRSGANPIGVLSEPIKYNDIGSCQVAGVCLAPVNITDADQTHCYATTGNARLQGNFGGPIEILHKPSGTGELSCVLRLASPCTRRKGITAASISAGGSGNVTVYISGSSKGTVTGYFNHMENGVSSIGSGVDVLVDWFDDELKWVIVTAECE